MNMKWSRLIVTWAWIAGAAGCGQDAPSGGPASGSAALAPADTGPRMQVDDDGARKEPDGPITAAQRDDTIDALLRALGEKYVFPEKGNEAVAAVRDRQKRGDYAAVTTGQALAKALTTDINQVLKDAHFRVRFSLDKLPEREKAEKPSAEELAKLRKRELALNGGFDKVERLPGNIGYIEFRGFMDEEAGAETVAAAMNFVANTDALIIDLRQNGGGNPAMVALICSYLFGPEPVHLNDLYWREGNRTDEFWTRKEVAGRRYLGKDVYVLTSHYTFSGAEEFSYNLKNLKRATIVGETTGGGAHPGGGFRLSEHFRMFVPTGRAISPITKTNWEGTGVEPDLKVAADLALKTAHLSALKKSVVNIKEPDFKSGVQGLIEKLQKELDEAPKSAQTNKVN
jgi:hypothetical protein